MSNTSGSPLVALSIHSTTYPVFPSCLFFFFFLPNPFLLLSLSSSLTIMASSAASILQRQYKGMTLLQPISWYVSNSTLSSISRAYTTPRSGLCSGSQEWQHFRMVPILYFTGPWDAKQYTRDVAIIGSPKTIYEGGYFKVRDGCIDESTPLISNTQQATMSFPEDYPFNPPTFRFNREFYHPNGMHDIPSCTWIWL